MTAALIFANVVIGLFVNRVLEWVKAVPWLQDEEKSKISGPLADLLSYGLSLLAVFLVSLIPNWPDFPELPEVFEPALETAIVIGSAKGWYEWQKGNRN